MIMNRVAGWTIRYRPGTGGRLTIGTGERDGYGPARFRTPCVCLTGR